MIRVNQFCCVFLELLFVFAVQKVDAADLGQFTHIPNELMYPIGAHLRYDTLIRVCKHWRQIFAFAQWKNLLRAVREKVDISPGACCKLYYLVGIQNEIRLMSSLIAGDTAFQKNFKSAAQFPLSLLSSEMVKSLQSQGLPLEYNDQLLTSCVENGGLHRERSGPKQRILEYKIENGKYLGVYQRLNKRLIQWIDIVLHHDIEKLKDFIRNGFSFKSIERSIIANFCYSVEFMSVLLSSDAFKNNENKEEILNYFLYYYTYPNHTRCLDIIELLLECSAIETPDTLPLDNILEHAHTKKDYLLIRLLGKHKLFSSDHTIRVDIDRDTYALLTQVEVATSDRVAHLYVSPLMYAVLARDASLVKELCAAGEDLYYHHHADDEEDDEEFMFSLGDILSVAYRVDQDSADTIVEARRRLRRLQ